MYSSTLYLIPSDYTESSSFAKTKELDSVFCNISHLFLLTYTCIHMHDITTLNNLERRVTVMIVVLV